MGQPQAISGHTENENDRALAVVRRARSSQNADGLDVPYIETTRVVPAHVVNGEPSLREREMKVWLRSPIFFDVIAGLVM